MATWEALEDDSEDFVSDICFCLLTIFGSG